MAQTELNIAKEQNRKLLLENSLLAKKNKEMKAEIESLQTKLSEKTQELADANAAAANSNNPVLLKLIHEFETTKERVDQENKDLRLNLMECQEELRRIEEAKLKLKLERDILHEKCSERLIETLDKENKELRADKSELNQRVRALENELSALTRENTEIKKLYEDLRTEYNNLEKKSNASTPIKIENKCFGTSTITPSSEQYRSQEQRALYQSAQKDQPEATAKQGNHAVEFDSKRKGEMVEEFLSSSEGRFTKELTDLNSSECRKLIADVSK